MTMSWIANTSQGRMVGDYISTSFVGVNAVGVFSSASAPIGSTFQQASWATTIPVTTEQTYPLMVKDEPVLSTQGDVLAPNGPVLTP